MKNMRFWRTALVATLVLTVMLSVTGGTIAWFTDSVTSANNIVKSGTLDVEMSWSDTQNGTYTKASKGAIFNHQLWEPGYTDVKYIKIENKGNLAFKYQIKVIPTVEKTEGEAYLGDVIDVYYKVVDNNFSEPKSVDDVKNWNYVSNVTGTMNVAEDAVHGAMLDDQKELTVALALHMQESAGNEYQNKSVGDGFVVKLLATQYTHEEDSFNDQYDAGATYPADYVVDSADDLDSILKNAPAGEVLHITLTDDVKLTTLGSSGVQDITPASAVIIDGQGKYSLTAVGAGVTPIGDPEAAFTLKNLTVIDKSVSYNEKAWEFGYLEIGGASMTCENVTFTDPIMVEGTNNHFINCSFVGYTDEANGNLNMYAAWVINGKSTFTDCTITGTRGIKICDMYAPEIDSVVIDGCTFANLTQKPGVAIDDEDNQDMNITIKNSTFINCQDGDQGLYIYETDNTVPTLENNVVAKGISTAAELIALGGANVEGTIILTNDIDLNGQDMESIGVNYNKNLVVKGNGHTISNAKLVTGGQNGMTNIGLFYVETGATLIVSDLKLDKVTVEDGVDQYTTGAAAVIGYANGGSTVNLNNVDVSNSSITNTKGNAAIYVGYTVSTVNLTDCDIAADCTVAGERTDKTGAFVGTANTESCVVTVNNCTKPDAMTNYGRLLSATYN